MTEIEATETDTSAPDPDDTGTGTGADANSDTDDLFRALLEGLRTSLPGVQVLFAFLLTAPLQSGFAELARGSRTAYSIAFYSSGIASILLIAPSVHQRLRAPISGLRRQSPRHLLITTWVTIAGTAAMAVAIVATVFLASSSVYNERGALLASGAVAIVLGWSWIFLPYVTFRKQ